MVLNGLSCSAIPPQWVGPAGQSAGWGLFEITCIFCNDRAETSKSLSWSAIKWADVSCPVIQGEPEHQVLLLESCVAPKYGRMQNWILRTLITLECKVMAACRRRVDPIRLAVSKFSRTDHLSLDFTLSAIRLGRRLLQNRGVDWVSLYIFIIV